MAKLKSEPKIDPRFGMGPIPARERPRPVDPQRRDGLFSRYWRATLDPSFNVVYVVLLLVVYELGLFWLAEDRRNAADVLLKLAFEGLGDGGTTIFHVVLIALLVVIGWRGLARGRPCFAYFLPFTVECTAYASFLSPVLLFLRTPLLARSSTGDLFLDIGAGVYEEILFRFILLGGFFWLVRADPWHRRGIRDVGSPVLRSMSHLGIALIGVFGSALAFAAYHHMGPAGESFRADVFWFRMLAGLLLALIYLTRGLAVAVYTHAIYDLMIHLWRI